MTGAYLCENADVLGRAYVYGGTAAVSEQAAAALAAGIRGEGC